MIDRLEVLVPESTPKRKDIWRDYEVRPASLGLPYAATLDADKKMALRVHYDFRVPVSRDKRNLKIDFTDTRIMTAHDLIWRITSLFHVTPEQALSLRIARIDLAADVYGVPVEWFKRHCRVRKKRATETFETCNTQAKKGAIRSLQFGKRPDLYRIYDKNAEKFERKEEILYEGMFSGLAAPVRTRVERQCSGRGVPEQLRTLGEFFDNVADIDPFPNLECAATETRVISTNDWAPQKWLMSIGLSAAVSELGEAAVRARLNRKGNASRIFSKYSDLLRAEPPGVTSKQLADKYKRGTIKQLNQPTTNEDGEIEYPAGGLMLTL